jgi:hypothetical protein
MKMARSESDWPHTLADAIAGDGITHQRTGLDVTAGVLQRLISSIPQIETNI